MRREPNEAHRGGGVRDKTTEVAALEKSTAPTRVSLHSAQVFRLLLKTSVGRNAHELSLFLPGFALGLSLVSLWKTRKLAVSGQTLGPT